MIVHDYVPECQESNGRKGVRSKKRVMEMLESVNLHGVANRTAGGMKQRLGIAQALINDPEFVIVRTLDGNGAWCNDREPKDVHR